MAGCGSNKVRIESVASSTQRLFQGIVDLVKVNATAGNVEVTLSIDNNVPPALMLDPQRVQQVLLNLMSNAIKFSEDGSVHVRVGFLTDDSGTHWLKVQVQDSGIGISPDAMKSLSEKFTQADASTTRRFGGTGLGLTINKRLSVLMGGDLAAESVLGEGSCFSFELPTEIADREVLGDGSGPVFKEHASLSGHILLAEDNKVNQMVAVRMLQKLGLTVDVAEDGAKAIGLLESGTHYDLILMDCQMPVLDGYAATQEIRQLEGSPQQAVPIVALTANALAGEREKCLDAGMNGYLTKPLGVEPLHEMLVQWLPDVSRSEEVA